MYVADLVVPPARDHPLAVLYHHLAVSGDALPVEGGLGEPPLASPEGALAGQEPVAQKTEAYALAPALDEVAVVPDEYILDVVRVVQEVDGYVDEAQAHDIAVLSGAPGQENEMVPGVIQEVTG